MEVRLTEVIAAKLPRALRGRRRFPPALLVGGAIVALLVLLAVLADVIAPYPFDQFHPRQRFSPPSLTWLAGTDEYGRDVRMRMDRAAKITLDAYLCAVTDRIAYRDALMSALQGVHVILSL